MLLKAEAGNATDAVRLHRQGRDGRTVCLQTVVRRRPPTLTRRAKRPSTEALPATTPEATQRSYQNGASRQARSRRGEPGHSVWSAGRLASRPRSQPVQRRHARLHRHRCHRHCFAFPGSPPNVGFSCRAPGATLAQSKHTPMSIKAEAANETDAVRLHRQGRDRRTVSLQTSVRCRASPIALRPAHCSPPPLRT